MQHSSLMLVADLDVICVAVDGAEANTPLIIHGDRMRALPIATQRMKSIPGGTFRSSSDVARSTYSSVRAARRATTGGKCVAAPLE